MAPGNEPLEVEHLVEGEATSFSLAEVVVKGALEHRSATFSSTPKAGVSGGGHGTVGSEQQSLKERSTASVYHYLIRQCGMRHCGG